MNKIEDDLCYPQELLNDTINKIVNNQEVEIKF